MPLNRREFVAAFGSSWLLAQAGPSQKPYGSGSFGEWIEDEFGLPAFRYTCDQTHDPKAVTQVGPGILSSTDHVHQVGNGGLIAIVSNYGPVQVRQDEGAPKFLNEYSPERSQFGGGIGYLTDGTETLSTFYPGNAGSFDRVFGVGYFRKKVASNSYSVDQAIVAPFGDDPVLISQVTIANVAKHGQSRASLRWIEYRSESREQQLLGRPGDCRALRRRSGADLPSDHRQRRQAWAIAREPALDRVLGMPGLSVLFPRLHRTIRRRRQRGGTAPQVRRSLHASLSRSGNECRPAGEQAVHGPRPRGRTAISTDEDEHSDTCQPVSGTYRRAGAGSFLRRSQSAGHISGLIGCARRRLYHGRQEFLWRGRRGAADWTGERPCGRARRQPQRQWAGKRVDPGAQDHAGAGRTAHPLFPVWLSSPGDRDPAADSEIPRTRSKCLEGFEPAVEGQRPALRNQNRAVGEARDCLALLLPAQQPHLRRFLRRAHPVARRYLSILDGISGRRARSAATRAPVSVQRSADRQRDSALYAEGGSRERLTPVRHRGARHDHAGVHG